MSFHCDKKSPELTCARYCGTRLWRPKSALDFLLAYRSQPLKLVKNVYPFWTSICRSVTKEGWPVVWNSWYSQYRCRAVAAAAIWVYGWLMYASGDRMMRAAKETQPLVKTPLCNGSNCNFTSMDQSDLIELNNIDTCRTSWTFSVTNKILWSWWCCLPGEWSNAF